MDVKWSCTISRQADHSRWYGVGAPGLIVSGTMDGLATTFAAEPAYKVLSTASVTDNWEVSGVAA